VLPLAWRLVGAIDKRSGKK
jgi:hypothetical protein